MKRLALKKLELDYNKFVKRSAQEGDCDIFVKEPCILEDADTGEIKVIYDELNLNSKEVINALQHIKYNQGKRTRGLASNSRVFGFRPRHPIRANYCSSTSLAVDYPSEHAIVTGLALKLEEYYQKYHPKGYSFHSEVTKEKVPEDWRLNKSSIFTSGIINKNNPLKYHFDTGNFNEVYSVMIVFKNGVGGGHLTIPEYGVKIELKDNSVLMFDGQSLMHGVTPIKYQNGSSYRFSIVYYSLKQMWKCLPINEELAWARNRKTEREKLRHNMPKEHYDMLKSRKGKQ